MDVLITLSHQLALVQSASANFASVLANSTGGKPGDYAEELSYSTASHDSSRRNSLKSESFRTSPEIACNNDPNGN